MRFKGFIGPSYKLASPNVDCQRAINLYAEINELGTGKEQEIAALYGTPGLRRLSTIGDGPIRGSFMASNGTIYVASGTKVYSVNSSFVETEIGTLTTATGPVSMADNGFDLGIVDGSVYGFSYTFLTSTWAALAFPEEIDGVTFNGAEQIDFIDGRFVLQHKGYQTWFISGINAVTFDILEFASIEGNPDKLTGLIVNYREIWHFGEQTTEVWFNSGDAQFPFSRVSGAFIEHGCAARFSVAKMDNAVFWVGKDDKGHGTVMMAQGYQPKKISTSAVDFAIQSYGDISDAVAYTYQDRGHSFYVLNFTSANTTWVYDLSTGLWHERSFTNLGSLERHRANSHSFAYGKHIVGDYVNGNLYELTDDVYTDDGATITRKRVAPHTTSGLRRVFYNSFQLDIEAGVGLDGVGQGTNPQVMLTFSDDGGSSWSNEKWADMGKIGARKSRAIWRRLGQSRDRVFCITITDPVKVVLIGAELDFIQGGM